MKAAEPLQGNHCMAVINRFFVLSIVAFALTACAQHSTNIKHGVSFDPDRCKPGSSDPDILALSQAACHVAVAGPGLQLLDTRTHLRLSLSSDTTRQEKTSLFISPDIPQTFLGPLEFSAFYSRGLAELKGKTGCVGVLESGHAAIEQERGQRSLRYDLTFRLVSPRGWKDDCAPLHHVAGSTRIDR